MREATRTAPATRPVVRELRLWQFTRSLEPIFDDLGNGRKYSNRSKSLAEARNLLDRWLLSFQMDYSDKMDKDFPVFPQKLRSQDSVNVKLMDECMEKHFSSDAANASEIFETLRDEVEKFKKKHKGDRYDDHLTIEYYEDDNSDNAEIVVQDDDGDFRTQNCQRVRFLVSNFGLEASARMLMRYESLGTGSLQWGDPITVHNALYREMGVRYEGFASPLNSKMLGKEGAHFCSLFFDTDEEFGSLGNFFSIDFGQRPGGWTVNPPFIESLMEKVADKILKYVQSDDRSVDNVFFVTFPRWTDTPGWEKLEKSQHLLDKIDLFSGDFTVQCCYGRVFPPRNDLTVFIVGRQLPPDASIDKIKRIFRDTDTEYIKQEWQKNCQIKMNKDQVSESADDKATKQLRTSRRDRDRQQQHQQQQEEEEKAKELKEEPEVYPPVSEYKPPRMLNLKFPGPAAEQRPEKRKVPHSEVETPAKEAKVDAHSTPEQQQQ